MPWDQFLGNRPNKPQSPNDLASKPLPKSPVSSSLDDVVPQMIIRSPRIRPGKFSSVKRKDFCNSICQKRVFCSSVLVPAPWSHGDGRREKKRFGLPGAWTQSSLAEIRFSQMLPNPTWLNDWRSICRTGFPIHRAPSTSSFLGDVGPPPE